MNIIALSLGLAPVPPLPPHVQQRQARGATTTAASTPARPPSAAATARPCAPRSASCCAAPRALALLDVATYYGLSITNTKAHLARMLADKHIRMVKECQRGRLTNVYHYAPAQP